MKLLVLLVFVFSICHGQSLFDIHTNFLSEYIESIREKLTSRYGDQFVDDFFTVYGKRESNLYFGEWLTTGLLDRLESVEHLKPNESDRINAETMEKYNMHSRNISAKHLSYIARQLDDVKILQSLSSQYWTPERYNGIINLIYILIYPNATSTEIKSTLDYLYGVDNSATQTSYLDSHDFSPTEHDCPRIKPDNIKPVPYISSKVVQDIIAINEKFPCTDYVKHVFAFLLELASQVHSGNNSRIDVCKLKEHGKDWSDYVGNQGTVRSWIRYRTYRMDWVEAILRTRLKDETFRDIINFINYSNDESGFDKIKKAFEYLYGVDEIKCP